MSTKSPEELAEIRNLTLAEFGDALAGLDAEDLAALKTLEQAEARPRAGALDAIDTASSLLAPVTPLTTIPPTGPEIGGASTAQDGDAKQPSAASAPAWQLPDYTGPLDLIQAEWRRANLKPVGGVATK